MKPSLQVQAQAGTLLLGPALCSLLSSLRGSSFVSAPGPEQNRHPEPSQPLSCSPEKGAQAAEGAGRERNKAKDKEGKLTV